MAESRLTLEQLEMRDDFVRRHIGPGDPQIAEMLKVLELDSLEALVEKTLPSSILTEEPLGLAEASGERETLSTLRRMSERNKVFISMIGMGYYGTVIPGVILLSGLTSSIRSPRCNSCRRTRDEISRPPARSCRFVSTTT